MHQMTATNNSIDTKRGTKLGRVFQISAEDALRVAQFAAELSTCFTSSEDPELLARLPVLAHDLPTSLRQELTEFRLSDEDGVLHLKGLLVDEGRIGPTPSDWRGKASPGPAFTEEITLLLIASLLGEPFGWRTQQDGHLVHEVFPIRQDEWAQLGSSSRVLLTWHTEDAFHPYRADFVLIEALRNPQRAPTTVSCVDPALIDSSLFQVLQTKRFVIQPDNSHLAEYNTGDSLADQSDFDEIQRMRKAPEPVALLFGDSRSPYIRIDPDFMGTMPGDELASNALNAVKQAIDANLTDVVLESGDILILDNYKVVHGRLPFQARYDGTDRWLKRVNVTQDLRKSRNQRASPKCRLIR